ncbi:hypothetical protein Tco_0694784 [Tanacetum coccineum]
MQEPALTGNQQLVDVNFLVEDSYLGSAKSRQLWQILLLRQNMLQLLIAVGKDCYEKRLIDVLKIHTDSNVADLLTKGFDVTSSLLDWRNDLLPLRFMCTISGPILNHEQPEVENSTKVNREAQQANDSLTKALEIFKENAPFLQNEQQMNSNTAKQLRF